MAYSSSTGSGNKPLTLGSMTFLSEECPSTIALGALTHKVVVTELYGGGRVTMNVGSQPRQVSWKGRFFQNQDAKFAILTAMQVSGQEVLCTYGVQQWYVKVIDISPDATYLDMAYDITLEITRSATGLLKANPSASATTQNLALASTASQNITSVVALDPSASTLSSAQAAMVQALGNTPLSTSSGPAITALGVQVQSVLTQARSYANSISSIDPRFLPISSAVNSLTLLAANITSTQKAASVTVTGGTMFGIASQYCGTPSQAYALMTLNGIYSPNLPANVPTDIYIPQSLRITASSRS